MENERVKELTKYIEGQVADMGDQQLVDEILNSTGHFYGRIKLTGELVATGNNTMINEAIFIHIAMKELRERELI